MPSMTKKRRRDQPRPTIHPKNKYADRPPEFALLASLYPSFQPFVFNSNDGRPKIDWTDFNATRELTRVLLHHDHGLDWWIPDGQLCPTVPNRSNYIHWIEDLLSCDIIPRTASGQDKIRGFDIGTGANCIYPLLGASLKRWSFVGSDVTDVALEWAERNVKSNPHISELIEIRKVEAGLNIPLGDSHNRDPFNDETKEVPGESIIAEVDCITASSPSRAIVEGHYSGPPILCGVVMDNETFDFCMCNPPFFESIEEAGLNPKTACGGTPEEMVCPGGERAFISRLIDDSIKLKQSFRWYTSMVGRKANLKCLTAKLRAVGVTIVKTTEFVQGQTCRWGIAWSFLPPIKKIVPVNVPRKNNLSFMLEGLQRQFGAVQVLQAVESFFQRSGASCKLNVSSFAVDIIASGSHLNGILKNKETSQCEYVTRASNGVDSSPDCSDLSFHIMVFQQNPGTLLVKGSLQNAATAASGAFFLAFQCLEEDLRQKFCREKVSMSPL